MSYYPRDILYFDGASRNNPRGPAGCGWILYEMDEYGTDGGFIADGSKYLGHDVSNNQAEYQGLIEGLEYVGDNIRCDNIYIRGDAEIVIRQMEGEYQVRSPNIRPYYDDAVSKLEYVKDSVTYGCNFRHIPRHKNGEADELANNAIDNE